MADVTMAVRSRRGTLSRTVFIFLIIVVLNCLSLALTHYGV